METRFTELNPGGGGGARGGGGGSRRRVQCGIIYCLSRRWEGGGGEG